MVLEVRKLLLFFLEILGVEYKEWFVDVFLSFFDILLVKIRDEELYYLGDFCILLIFGEVKFGSFF